MPRIAVLTDAHANLPAIEAALREIAASACDAIYHTGDAVGIGPFPAETLDRLLHTPRVRPVMGNHDAWFAFGLPAPRPTWMDAAEGAHQRWTHAQIDPGLRAAVAAWPWAIEEEVGGVPVAFVHYALDETGRGFVAPPDRPDAATMDRMFADLRARLVFYGHQHYPTPVTPEIVGRARYLTADALGCSAIPVARFALLDVDRVGETRVAFRAVAYDPAPLLRAFEEREVPERTFIRATFFESGFWHS